MPATAERIRKAFDFLLQRGYTLAVESDAGMAGTIAYRSPLLWISLEWERSNPWLSVTLTRTAPNSFSWPLIDRVLSGKLHPEYPLNSLAEAPVERLATWVRENLDELERHLVAPFRAEFEARLRAADSNARRAREETLRTRRFH